MDKIPVLKQRTIECLSLMKEMGTEVSQENLAEQLNRSVSTVSSYLQELRANSLVRRKRTDAGIRYYLINGYGSPEKPVKVVGRTFSYWSLPELDKLFLFRDIQKLSWKEIAEVLKRTVASCRNSYYQRRDDYDFTGVLKLMKESEWN